MMALREKESKRAINEMTPLAEVVVFPVIAARVYDDNHAIYQKGEDIKSKTSAERRRIYGCFPNIIRKNFI